MLISVRVLDRERLAPSHQRLKLVLTLRTASSVNPTIEKHKENQLDGGLEAQDTDAEDSPWEVSSDSEAGYTEPPRQSGALAASQGTNPILAHGTDQVGSFTSSLDLVEHMVSCLWRLPIRRPAPLDRMKESASDTTPYQPFDIMHVKEKFPFIEERLATRLGRMISRRRQLLRYRKSHTDAIRGSQLTARRPIFAARFGSIEESYETTPSMTASTRHTQDTMATTLKLDQQNYVIPDVNDFFAPSIASSSSSTFSANSDGESSIKIPKRPEGVGKRSSEQFICPYCQTTQTVSTERKWRLVFTRLG